MAAQMILRASGRVSADSISALGRNGTLAAAATTLYATPGAFRALTIAALGFVGGAAYLSYSKGVGFTKYLLSPATHRAPRHVRQRAKGLKEEWRGMRLRSTREIQRLTKN